MSTSFPSHQQPPNGQYPAASPSYPPQYQPYPEPYSQSYVPGNYVGPPQGKPNFDPRQQMNGYTPYSTGMSMPSQNQMMAAGMPPAQFGAPQLRQYQQYGMQQPMMSQMAPGQQGVPNMNMVGNSQMGPHGMQMNGMGAMGPPVMNGNHSMMPQQPQQRPPSQQMKSPMPGSAPMLQRSDSNSGKQMNSPGTFTAPLPRTKSNSTHSQHSPGIYPHPGQQAPGQTPPHPPQVSTPSSVNQQSSMPSPQQPHMGQMNNQMGGQAAQATHMGNQNTAMTNGQNGVYPNHNNMMGGQMNNQSMKMEMSPMNNLTAHSSPIMGNMNSSGQLSNGSMMGHMNQQMNGQNMIPVGKNQMVTQQNYAMMKKEVAPFTAAINHDMPPAFQEHMGEFKKVNPALDLYFGRNQQMLKMPYPLGNNSYNVMPIEPPTFAFMPGQKFYDERFDRRNIAIQRQMAVPQSYLPQSMQAAAPAPTAAPPAKKSRKGSRKSTDSAPTTSAPPTPRGNPPMYPGPPSHSIDMSSPMNIPSTSTAGMNCNPGQQQSTAMNTMAGQGNYNNQMGGPGGYSMPMQSPVNGTMKPQFMMQQQQQQINGQGGYPPNGMITDPQRMQQMNQMSMQQQYQQREMQQRLQPTSMCVACSQPISNTQPGMFCNAPACQRAYHKQCTGLSPEAMQLFERDSKAKWICSNCQQLASHSH